MAPIPEHDALALNGVEIGDATKVTLVCTADNQGLTSGFTGHAIQNEHGASLLYLGNMRLNLNLRVKQSILTIHY